MAYVYTHTRLDIDKVFYVGISSRNNYYRASTKYKRSKFWKSIVSKSDYKIDILIDNITYIEAKEIEKYLISFYGRRDLNLGTLVNMTDGGDGLENYKPTKESIEKTASKLRGKCLSEEHKEKISKGNTGKKFSDETKSKISIKLQGNKNSLGVKWKRKNPYSNEEKIARSLRLKGNINASKHLVLNMSTGIYYDNVHEAARSLNRKTTTVWNWLSGKRKNKSNLIIV